MMLQTRPARAVGGLLAAASLVLAVGAVPAAGSEPVLSNGGFERGWFKGWGHPSQDGSSGEWRVDQGSTSPISRFRIPAPPEGRFQAVADQGGPGSHLLFRKIAVDEADLAVRLTFWYRNRAGVFFSPRTLRFDRVRNQQFRIDVLRPGARLDSLADRAVLATPFRTAPGRPFTVGPRRITFDLSRFRGQDVRLRIAEVDNQFFFQAGVDAVELVRGAGQRALGGDSRVTPLRLRERHARPAPVLGTYVR
jgi:hypothetical protein